ncbi:secondary thiamine-phosphate synthase enzyme YjbQ [Acidisoma silvae]|uniref:YjbQ family protein n=1 Tax=Acidisoma silvae TaxID=2802396 RepID=A0A963YN37_9PROT|nr:secondary thiamine-phosphate synthase enzyme YjbQ [Acidisoma silvae]MCB8873561.1 YjbQ family protein [Acidisoma silvae]
MRQATDRLSIQTRGKGLTEFTRAVWAWVDQQGMETGLLTLWCAHTSASLAVTENASPEVLVDIADAFERLVPEDRGQAGAQRYIHSLEGPDDMPSHIRTLLTGPQLTIPLAEGRLALGTWQGIFLFEHRTRPHRREVALHLIGE